MADPRRDVIRVPESMVGLARSLGRVPSPEEALWLFATPVRVEMARKELAIANMGHRFEFDSGGVRLAGYEWGVGGKTILLLHGWNGRATNLSSFVPPLVQAGFRVVGFDAHGHGDSQGDYCYAPLMAQAAQDISDHVGGLYGLVAHSFGTCACTVALKQGLIVEKVVYLSTMCWIKQRFYEFAVAAGLDGAGQDEMWRVSEDYFGPGLIESFHGDVAAREFTAEALIVHDEDDVEISYSQSEALAEAWPGSELWLTRGFGHFRIIRSGAVVDRAVGFLANEV